MVRCSAHSTCHLVSIPHPANNVLRHKFLENNFPDTRVTDAWFPCFVRSIGPYAMLNLSTNDPRGTMSALLHAVISEY